MLEVVEPRRLERAHLTGLRNKFAAVVIAGAVSVSQSNALVNYAEHTEKQDYTHEVKIGDQIIQQTFGVDRIGEPFNKVNVNDPASLKNYFAAAQKNIQKMREACAPLPTPFENFLRNLNHPKTWPAGAQLAQWQGQEMFGGILRFTKPNAIRLQEQGHIDHLDTSANIDPYTGLINRFNETAQLSANFYIEMPKQGGELVIYDHEPLSFAEAKTMEGDPERWKDFLSGLPQITIQPREGDMILLNTRRAHAVKVYEQDQGRRITQQTFIGLNSFDEPLYLWT